MSNFTDFVGGGGEGFEGVDLSSAGSTHTMDLSQGNYFIGGELTQDTTLAFSNIPQVAKWSYSAVTGSNGQSDLSVGSFTGKILSTFPSPLGIHFKPDGTKLYVLSFGNDRVYEYNLLTAWDLTTANYTGANILLSSQDTETTGIYFKPDGTVMYTVARSGDRVFQYSLSTAWSLATASHVNPSFSVGTQQAVPFGIEFKPDGTKMYITGTSPSAVHQYSLSTPWSLSTASYDNISFSFTSENNSAVNAIFNENGTKMYMLGLAADRIYQYSLSTAWDLNTASYDSVSFFVGDKESSAFGLFFKSGIQSIFISGEASNSVLEIDVSQSSSLTMPSSVEDTELQLTEVNKRITYEFSTVDGGTNVQLLKQEVTP